MRFLTFKDSDAKILLASADEPISADEAATRLVAGEELAGYVIQHLDLDGLNLSKLALRNCIVEDASLTNTRVDHFALDRVVLANSTLVGLTVHAMTLRGSLVTSCRFDYAQLQGMEITEPTAFLSCSFRDTDLAGVRAPGSVFHDCDFTAADLRGARIIGADLRGSNLDGAHGLATLHGATLSGDQLAQVVEAVATDQRLDIREGSDTGPVTNWREVPET